MNYRLLAALAVIGLSGCTSLESSRPVRMASIAPEEGLTWVRTDGQSGRANPALLDQFAADRAACVAPPADNAALRAAESCMSARGYVLVAQSQAAATAAEFRRRQGY
ncbi:hypothetical protein [Prosthecomicrobium pneumaticum]|uniref:Uncharacterized protein n=1 Tax=Prosthecomicrobium pneumaticum TaxID=81895 RepID=A0A7W9L2R8_9HYPH|nr:hypothetical protein [Prosthecomicrobium pneumaticum]MBB5753773.1 hypothetical protein [Prosthecomicrobium pneumaticum]